MVTGFADGEVSVSLYEPVRGSDVFIVPGAKVTCKVKGELIPLTEERMMPADAENSTNLIVRMISFFLLLIKPSINHQ